MNSLLGVAAIPIDKFSSYIQFPGTNNVGTLITTSFNEVNDLHAPYAVITGMTSLQNITPMFDINQMKDSSVMFFYKKTLLDQRIINTEIGKPNYILNLIVKLKTILESIYIRRKIDKSYIFRNEAYILPKVNMETYFNGGVIMEHNGTSRKEFEQVNACYNNSIKVFWTIILIMLFLAFTINGKNFPRPILIIGIFMFLLGIFGLKINKILWQEKHK